MKLVGYQSLGEACGGRDAGILFWHADWNLDQRKNYQLMEVGIFSDADALQRFRTHPAHAKFGKDMSNLADWVVGISMPRSPAPAEPLWRAIAGWCSSARETIGLWLNPLRPETPLDRAIRAEGERIRTAFPDIDFDHPGAAKRPPDPLGWPVTRSR